MYKGYEHFKILFHKDFSGFSKKRDLITPWQPFGPKRSTGQTLDFKVIFNRLTLTMTHIVFQFLYLKP